MSLATWVSAAPTFKVSYKAPEKAPAYTARVYVVLSKKMKVPANGITSWFSMPDLLAQDDPNNSGKVIINGKSLSTIPLNELDGQYHAQAVVRLTPDWPVPGMGEDDLVSEPRRIQFEKGKNVTFDFVADQTLDRYKFDSEGSMQSHYFKSEKLSKFHKRNYRMRYSVILPKDWDGKKKYPVIYVAVGFGGEHYQEMRRAYRMFSKNYPECIVVIPDANCRWGHSVFANSLVNGPWGDALVEELIPHVEKKYGGAGAAHRYVTGVSSGGWASLWLAVNYADAFRACWSVAPDPVDFRLFQEIRLDSDKELNLFKDDDKNDRYLSIERMGMKYKKFAEYERVLGAGGQLKSFGAVFTHKVKNGEPIPWYDEKTGRIRPTLYQEWEPYDISRLLQKNWKTLGPKTQGKLHIIVHETDLFHLNHSVKKLEETCKKLGSDATFTYLPGRGHHMPLSSAKKMLQVISDNWDNQ